MQPYAVEEVVEERQRELHRAARGRVPADIRPGEWRRAAARGLVALAVAVGGPGDRRARSRARQAASAALDLCPER